MIIEEANVVAVCHFVASVNFQTAAAPGGIGIGDTSIVLNSF
jgi:hypothetical protein